ncbi:MAG: trimeric intracellular cation channel family protein [Pseudohaliea sp.]
MTLATLLTWTDLLAVAVFAISGALAAAEQKLDVLAFILFGTITGVGGGTLRDLLLQAGPVFWIADTRYLWVCIGVSMATWYLAPLLRSRVSVLVWADAFGLALFSVLGTAKALGAEAPVIVAVVMGVMSASFGSLIRDTLLNRSPVLLEPEIYVTAALLGAASYALLAGVPWLDDGLVLLLAMAGAFALRAAAIAFDLRLPNYRR